MPRRKRTQFWGAHPDDDRLVREILAGQKTATVCKAAEYHLAMGEFDDGDMQVGDIVDVFDLRGRCRGAILVTEVYPVRFGAIPEKLWRGENCASAEHFREVHRRCWPHEALTDDFEMIATHFELVASGATDRAALEFRRVDPAEVAAAHAVYLEAFAWLKAKGVRQWLRAVPREEFGARQARGELFGGWSGGALAAVATLAVETSPYWQEEIGPAARAWLKTLAVARGWRGAGLGARLVDAAEATWRAGGREESWLDCVDTGFLPRYYAARGYRPLARKDITYPSGNTFPVVLMSKRLD
jgi:uncharacterized protein YhfF